ncbi:glycine betaine ABC transporter substrate-binding protein [Desulfobacula sp.]
MSQFKKSIRVVILTIASIVFALGTSWAARKNVIIAEQSWTGSAVICQVMKHVLENKLDIPAKVTPLSGAVAWVGMDKGDVDIFSDIWETAEIAGIEKYTKEKKSCEVVLSYPNAPQGWYIPRFAAEKLGIKTIADLKGKEKFFDIDANGKGDIWGGPTSWKVNEITSVKVRDYGLDLETLGVEQWAWLATLKSAILKKQPVIFYYWEPEWLFTEYDLVKIQEPAYEDAKWKFVQGKPDQSKITCEIQPTNVWVGMSKKMETRLPKAYKFFKNWSIPIGEVNNLISMVTDLPGNPKMSSADAAKKWVDAHPDIVNAWLK